MDGDSFSIMFHPFCDWLEQFLVTTINKLWLSIHTPNLITRSDLENYWDCQINVIINYALASGQYNFWLLFEVLIERFLSRGQHLCKFIGTKESVSTWFKSHKTGLEHQYGRRSALFRNTNMVAVTSLEASIGPLCRTWSRAWIPHSNGSLNGKPSNGLFRSASSRQSLQCSA